jgi:hypothetical protein
MPCGAQSGRTRTKVLLMITRGANFYYVEPETRNGFFHPRGFSRRRPQMCTHAKESEMKNVPENTKHSMINFIERTFRSRAIFYHPNLAWKRRWGGRTTWNGDKLFRYGQKKEKMLCSFRWQGRTTMLLLGCAGQLEEMVKFMVTEALELRYQEAGKVHCNMTTEALVRYKMSTGNDW